MRNRQPRRARASRARRGRSRKASCQDPPCRRDLPRPSRVGVARRLLRGPQPRAAHLAHRALLVAARGLRFPEALERDRRVARGGAHPRQGRGHARARRRPRGPCVERRVAHEMKTPASLVRGEILALTAYHTPPAPGMVKLDAMENPYRLPAQISEALARRLAQVAVNRYPDPTGAALKAQ